MTLSQLFCRLLRDQWIRAKYEREEFTSVERQEPYSAGGGHVHRCTGESDMQVSLGISCSASTFLGLERCHN